MPTFYGERVRERERDRERERERERERMKKREGTLNRKCIVSNLININILEFFGKNYQFLFR